MILLKDASKIGLMPSVPRTFDTRPLARRHSLLLAAGGRAPRMGRSRSPHAGRSRAGCANGLSQPGSSLLLFCTLAEQAPSEARGDERRARDPLIPDLSCSSPGACLAPLFISLSCLVAQIKADKDWATTSACQGGGPHCPQSTASSGCRGGRLGTERPKEAPPPPQPTDLPGPKVTPWPLPEPRKIHLHAPVAGRAQKACGCFDSADKPTGTVPPAPSRS